MGCRHQCKGRRAAAERSAERSKRSKSFRRMGCRHHCKKAACVHSEKHRAQQAKQTLQPHGLSPPLQRAASDASATAAWTATTDAKGSSRALSEALNAASEASAPVASAAVADSKTGVRRAACVHCEKHRAQQARQALQPHGLPPALQGVASNASATAAWTATTDAKSGSRALSEAFSAASEASATAASAAVADSKTGVRALSEASSAARKASATATRAAAADGKSVMRALSEASGQQAMRALQPHELPPPIQGATCTERSIGRNTRSECSWATATRAAAADAKGGVRAPSEASSAASEASAAATIANVCMRALSKPSSAASEASAAAE